MKTKTLKICMLGVFIALYVVANATLHFNVFGNITTDFAYVVFGAALVFFGIDATWVGVIGVALTSILTSAWGFSPSWVAMNLVIGIGCGLTFERENLAQQIGNGIAFVFLGLVVKSIIECCLYGVPFTAKIPKALVCWIIDSIGLVAGIVLGYTPALRKYNCYFD